MKKFGRIYHLPNSPGATSDDKILSSIDGLVVDDLVITEKIDGENTTIHRGGIYARSPDSRYHPSRDWVKAFAAGICPLLRDGERIVGENLYARHAIAYSALPSFFLGFAWILEGRVQSWDSTLHRFEQLGIAPVPMLYRGPYAPGLFDATVARLDQASQEGFVVRLASEFGEDELDRRMGKFVRHAHVKSDIHWMNAPMVPNRLADASTG